MVRASPIILQLCDAHSIHCSNIQPKRSIGECVFQRTWIDARFQTFLSSISWHNAIYPACRSTIVARNRYQRAQRLGHFLFCFLFYFIYICARRIRSFVGSLIAASQLSLDESKKINFVSIPYNIVIRMDSGGESTERKQLKPQRLRRLLNIYASLLAANIFRYTVGFRI